MAGYLLLEKRMLQPHKVDGIAPNMQEVGFIDYLRELRQDVFPFARGSKLRLIGLESVLLDAKDRGEIGAEIHKLLAGRANELDRMGGFVQVVFEWKLFYGNELWFERGNERIPLRGVFGTAKRAQEGSNIYYLTGFNLT
ncbi:MAG: hypothetical protein EXR86_16660 [Gammaproteobacteria bacterium]|nr:hypothetical protein [Gammaproteobacteria bacterium]